VHAPSNRLLLDVKPTLALVLGAVDVEPAARAQLRVFHHGSSCCDMKKPPPQNAMGAVFSHET
jgi:hypothetical protein